MRARNAAWGASNLNLKSQSSINRIQMYEKVRGACARGWEHGGRGAGAQ
jgi:hypothetical protein